MKKIIKKVLSETLEDKRLQIAYVYLCNYIDTLEKYVREDGDIYFYESGDRYAKVWIWNRMFQCWVDRSFCKEFCELFSLHDTEFESLITKLLDDEYDLKRFSVHINIKGKIPMIYVK